MATNLNAELSRAEISWENALNTVFQVERLILALGQEVKKEEPVDALIHKKRQNEVRVSGLKLKQWNRVKQDLLQAILACRSSIEPLESEEKTADETKVESLKVFSADYEIKAQIHALKNVRKQSDDMKIKSEPQPEELDFRVARFISLISNDGTMKMKDQIEALGHNGQQKSAVDKLSLSIIIKEKKLLHSLYQQLRCELTPLDIRCKEYSMIENYMRHGSKNYKAEIVQVFRATREGESERFQKFAHVKNRMLLWHGSKLRNWTGILSQGLRMPEPEAPRTSYLFGKGIYFADMFSKSASYCGSNGAASDGVLALCEVALGDMNELFACNYDAHEQLNGKLSTKGIGKIAPDLSEAEILEDGVLVPLGKPKNILEHLQGEVSYNEYIVYNVDQIRIRYMVHVNFSTC